VNLENIEHIQVVAEAMYDACEDENIVNEFVESFVGEGKYPDRQAYNKDGWLVTFPSAQYKQAAIKKGTHYPSDPTHGKGGMNLYYKKRGKQKRQTQQTATATEPADQSQKVAPTGKQPAQTPVPAATDANNDQSARATRLAKLTGGTETKPVASQDSPVKPTDASAEKSSNEPDSPPSSEKPEAPSAPAALAPTVPAAPSYTALSVKFATSKGWKSTPYGEYRDETGSTAAVVGLSGEVVPIKNVDREEFKIFVEKNPM
jgi:hypothetical protein